MLVKEGYFKEYYQNNKEKSKKSFQKWYSDPKNKEKLRIYMRNYMRKKNNIPKDKWRVKDEPKRRGKSDIKA